MKKIMHVLKAAGIVLCVFVLALAGLYLYADNKPDIHKGYQKTITTGGPLEAHYLANGPYETKRYTKRAAKPIGKYTVYYPEDMVSSNVTYPMVLVVNGTGGKASKYEPEFALYASWGFITVGTQDKGTGSGATTIQTLQFMLEQNADPDSIFYQKVDVSRIGITGFSQGGAAVFNALTKYPESSCFAAAAPLSPVSEQMARTMTDYPYDSSLVKCPIMILAGTSGSFETETVIPLADLKEQYAKITAPKVIGRRTGMDHDHMMYSAGGYVVAWFRWQLMNDSAAAKVFTGDDPELLHNAMYQDQQIDLER